MASTASGVRHAAAAAAVHAAQLSPQLAATQATGLDKICLEIIGKSGGKKPITIKFVIATTDISKEEAALPFP